MSALAPASPAACVFCKITHGLAQAVIVEIWDDAVAFVPRDPVTGEMQDGHVLVVPRQHVVDYTESDDVAALVVRRCAQLTRSLRAKYGRDFNKITSSGSDATQTVPHYHEHLVQREAGDGLALPWTGQAERLAAKAGERS
jgi:histidine triad (HIT) family protein